MKRAITLALAAGALCLVVAAILGRDELLEQWYVYQISRDESRFDELLREGGDLKRRALKRYLRTAEAQAFLARRCEDVLRLELDRPGPSSERMDWMNDASFGAMAVVVDTMIRSGHKDRGGMAGSFKLLLGHDERFDQAAAFLILLDGLRGTRFRLPNSPDIVVEILPAREALPRAGCYPYPATRGNRAVGKTTTTDVEKGPPDDWTEEHTQALGDHPALFYSRE